MVRNPVWAGSACLVLWGCGTERYPERGEASPGCPAGAPIKALPVLSVTGESGNRHPRFLSAGSATRFPNGTIVVADKLQHSILFIDPDGDVVRAVGRQGSGPGEFQSPGWVRRCSEDSVHVWDSRLARMTVIDSSGNVVREFRLPHPPYRLSCAPGHPLAVLDRPRIIERMDPQGRNLRRYFGTLWLADAEGKEVRVIGEIDAGENRPLGRLTHIAVAAGRVYVGTAESAFVNVHQVNGKPLPAIDVRVPRREPTEADYQEAVDQMVAGFTDPGYREQMREDMLRMPQPDQLPVYGEILSDPRGSLWIVISAPADSVTVLRVIGPDGGVLGDVSLPRDARVLEVGEDYLLTLEHSELGEQRLVVYEAPKRMQVH